ncbi:outer membrane beta-barrel protein [Sphingobacterium sp. N143]|uniref:outer membrane beta-barrel protein n=1 Tax=Sphingobacterium sp. N143 TaxID=2746727 RepID=UPI002578600F|nr:outer membrane beta-barrel protein [Sphingobacterium sp. N143]MDM1293456.1 outer membrane beta-barrel protein [Sphingobacterium sp. N143]
MKSIFSFVLFLFAIGTIVHAQEGTPRPNALAVQYGLSTVIIPNESFGVASLEGHSHSIGLLYYRDISYDLGLETGIRYSFDAMNKSGINGGGEKFDIDYKASYIHVPILLQYNFLKVLFAQLGPTVSVQVQNENDINKSGVGLWASFGAKLEKEGYVLKLNPYYHSQSMIAFSSNSYQSQQNLGVNLSVGLKF